MDVWYETVPHAAMFALVYPSGTDASTAILRAIQPTGCSPDRTTPATVLSSLLGTVGFVADRFGTQYLASSPSMTNTIMEGLKVNIYLPA
jgi:hypothetical protein